MPSFRIVLVSPKNAGNVGAVVRSMGNFGLRDLYLVTPCEVSDEAFKRAKHAGDILRSARVVPDLDAAIAGCDLLVGTSGIVTQGEKHYVRIPLTPRQLAERTKDSEAQVALIFGPEDAGLSQEDLMRCDVLVHVPASQEYPVLNLSHAASIVMYELFQAGPRQGGPREASEMEREKLFQFFDDLLDAVDYPEFRRQRTNVMFRRLMGRAVPTKWEFHTIMGILGDAAKRIRRLESERED